ncbi:beta strand repeat-containing protein, partial [Clostridium botulinum]|uniref:beta strand repeat-containing protein n=1 Tax=Clostridium botulinum TaxID=1491 RepID=UPI001E63B330
MPITPIFSKNANAAITFTGNALGLSKASNIQDMGTESAIGAYITNNTTSSVSTYPNGTTATYSLNSSSAVLNIPSGSTILYAELIWGGSCQVQSEDYTSSVNTTAISFTIPTTPPQVITIDSSYTPAPVTRFQPTDSGNATFYIRRANVTSLVQNALSGTYTVSGAIGTTQALNNSDNSCGWTLAVCYENSSLPSRYLALYSNIEAIAPNSTTNINISNFKTPTSGSTEGRILLSALRGSATDTGDQVLFGPNTSSLTPLSGPRNLENNFFGSQINGNDGNLDTSGTFGNRNQDILTATNISGGRQSQDITNVNATSKLTNNQTNAVLQFKAAAREYFINALGTQIDIDTPIFNNLNITTNKQIVSIGSTVDYTIAVKNSGTVDAKNVTLTDILPTGLAYKSNTLTIGGTPNSGNPTTGVSLGAINAGQTIEVKFTADVNADPTGDTKYVNSAKIDYSFDITNDTVTTGTVDTITKSDTSTNTIYPQSIVITPTVTKTDKSSNTIEHVVLIGDTVTYTINIHNPDATKPITNINLIDVLPSGLTFKTGSVIINGTSQSSANPTTGISLSNIAPNSDATISFIADVSSAPPIGTSKYVNNANVEYSFQAPDSTVLTNTVTATNTIYPFSVVIIPTFRKEDKTSGTINHVVSINDNVTYTITIRNPDATKSLTNITLTDSLPSGLTFKSGSVSINSTPNASANPTTGISLSNIAPGTTTTISFVADVTGPPTGVNSLYLNTATIEYSFLSPDSTILTSSATTPNSIYGDSAVITPTVTKTDTTSNAIPHIVAINDTVDYTITIHNPSTTKPITNIKLTDNLPTGLTFKASSVSINGIPDTSADPTTGISISSIAANSNATISFVVDVTAAPSPGTSKYVNNVDVEYSFQASSTVSLTNTVTGSNTIYPTSVVITPTLAKTSVSSNAIQGIAAVGDTIEYTITIENTSATDTIKSATLNDTLPSGLTYKTGTLTVNTITSNDPLTAVTLGDINPNSTTTVKFTADVANAPATGSKYVNPATVNYSFLSPDGTTLNNSVSANNTVYSNDIIITPTVSKTATSDNAVQDVVAVGNTIEYTITIENTSATATIKNATLNDALPTGLTYKTGTLSVNSASSNDPLTAITLGDISPS